MTNEEKQLLLRDLCVRLPYGVILQLNLLEGETINSRLTGIDEDGNLTADVPADCAFSIENVKPYLRPITSITKSEKQEIRNFFRKCIDDLHGKSSEEQFFLGFCQDAESLDYLNIHHFDYRGLIEKGLALEALEGMYNTKTE